MCYVAAPEPTLTCLERKTPHGDAMTEGLRLNEYAKQLETALDDKKCPNSHLYSLGACEKPGAVALQPTCPHFSPGAEMIAEDLALCTHRPVRVLATDYRKWPRKPRIRRLPPRFPPFRRQTGAMVPRSARRVAEVQAHSCARPPSRTPPHRFDPTAHRVIWPPTGPKRPEAGPAFRCAARQRRPGPATPALRGPIAAGRCAPAGGGSMEVGNPAVAGPRTRRNKARRWSPPGARAARPHAAPPGAAPRGCGPAALRGVVGHNGGAGQRGR